MATVKKTISLPEDLYNEAKSISNNFSELIKEALKEYIRRKKIEKTLSTAGVLKDLKETGIEYMDKLREEDLLLEDKKIGK